MAPRRNPKWLTKPGKHGPLTRYTVVFESRIDAGEPRESYGTWAYDPEHAEETFWEWLQQFNPGDHEYRVVSIRPMARKAALRANPADEEKFVHAYFTDDGRGKILSRHATAREALRRAMHEHKLGMWTKTWTYVGSDEHPPQWLWRIDSSRSPGIVTDLYTGRSRPFGK